MVQLGMRLQCKQHACLESQDRLPYVFVYYDAIRRNAAEFVSMNETACYHLPRWERYSSARSHFKNPKTNKTPEQC